MADITNADGVVTALGIFVDFGTTTVPKVQYVCAVNERAHTITTGEVNIPVVEACGPGAGQSNWRSLTETSWQVSGSGRGELTTFEMMREWRDSKKDRKVYVVYYSGDKDNLTAVGYYAGPGVLREYNAAQGNADDLPVFSINIQNGKGSAPWTAGAPSFVTP